MNQLDRFGHVIRAASANDSAKFLVVVADHHNTFGVFIFHNPALPDYENNHAVYGFYYAAAQIAREIGILPGTSTDIMRLITQRYWFDGTWTDNAAISFVKKAGDTLMALIAADPTAWDVAKADAEARSRCTLFDNVMSSEQMCRLYIELA